VKEHVPHVSKRNHMTELYFYFCENSREAANRQQVNQKILEVKDQDKIN
jgi:hypothetical protein